MSSELGPYVTSLEVENYDLKNRVAEIEAGLGAVLAWLVPEGDGYVARGTIPPSAVRFAQKALGPSDSVGTRTDPWEKSMKEEIDGEDEEGQGPAQRPSEASPFDTGTSAESMGIRVVEGFDMHAGQWRVLGPWRNEKREACEDAKRVACPDKAQARDPTVLDAEGVAAVKAAFDRPAEAPDGLRRLKSRSANASPSGCCIRCGEVVHVYRCLTCSDLEIREDLDRQTRAEPGRFPGVIEAAQAVVDGARAGEPMVRVSADLIYSLRAALATERRRPETPILGLGSIEAAELRGKAEERQRIVKWLRTPTATGDTPLVLGDAADEIERGEHRKVPDEKGVAGGGT